MNNDLISRSALVQHAFTAEFDGKPIDVVALVDVDNAPTVFSCNACKNMGNERECVDCHDYSNYVHYDERPQGEWVPVSERLPEALQSVLVTSKGGYVYTSYIVHGEWEYGGEVIAWQPLPEPYQKGGVE